MQIAGTILVVDDRESNRQLLQDMLESAGHHALCARDGKEAIDLALTGQPEVIRSTSRCPAWTGFEVCMRLQRSPRPPASRSFSSRQLHRGTGLAPRPRGRRVRLSGQAGLASVLLARVGVMLRIRRSEERIRRLSMIDEFTCLFSKTYVLRRLEEEMQRAQRRDLAR